MAVICKKYNLLYICVPKTGSTSISNLLIEQLGGEWLPEKNIYNEKGIIIVDKKHAKVDELLAQNVITDEELNSLMVFTTVRNPFDMVLSNFYFEKQIYERFKNGIKYRLLFGRRSYYWVRKWIGIDKKNEFSWIIPQAPRYRYTNTHSFEDYVVKFYSKKEKNIYDQYISNTKTTFLKLEEIKKELSSFLRVAGVEKQVHLPHLSKSNRKTEHYRKHYSTKARKIIEEVFKTELETFGYSF